MSATTSHSRFSTTSWTLLRNARSDSAAMGRLLAKYWRPVYSFVRRSGYTRADAAEITQDFVAEVMLGRDLVGRADPASGRFRSFVKAALKNYLIDRGRSRTGRRADPLLSSMTSAALDAVESSDVHEPLEAYDRQWAKTILTIALEQVRDDCHRSGLGTHWSVFERRALLPHVHTVPPPSLERIASELQLQSADVVSGMMFTVKRKLRIAIHSLIAETVSSPTDIEDEIRDLRKALGV